LGRNLADLLLGNRSASIEEMHKVISRHAIPIMITSHLLTEDWQHDGRGLTIEFMKFWNAWPVLRPGQLLLICLCIKYQKAEKLGFFRKRKLKKLNTGIRDFLRNVDLSSYEKLHGVTIELRAVPRKDAEDWARSKYVYEFCHFIENSEIRRLYERTDLLTSEGYIPMEQLADECKKLLIKYRIDRRMEYEVPLLYRET
jgi:hypothetical protein